jgi:hypothetical protein
MKEKYAVAVELRNIIDTISTEKVVEAIKLMNIIKNYGLYPSGKIKDICDQLPSNGMPNDYPLTEMAFMFALGQAYQSKNSKVLELFVNDLLREYDNAYARYKECYDNEKNPYEKAKLDGVLTEISNIRFDLKKKMSEFG